MWHGLLVASKNERECSHNQHECGASRSTRRAVKKLVHLVGTIKGAKCSDAGRPLWFINLRDSNAHRNLPMHPCRQQIRRHKVPWNSCACHYRRDIRIARQSFCFPRSTAGEPNPINLDLFENTLFVLCIALLACARFYSQNKRMDL